MNKLINKVLDEYISLFGKNITKHEGFVDWLTKPLNEGLVMEYVKHYGERWKYHSRHTKDIYTFEFYGDIGLCQHIILKFKTLDENGNLVSGSDFQLMFSIHENMLDVDQSQFSLSLKKPEADCNPILVHCHEGLLGENKKLKKLFILLSNTLKNKSTYQLERFLFEKLFDPANKVEL